MGIFDLKRRLIDYCLHVLVRRRMARTPRDVSSFRVRVGLPKDRDFKLEGDRTSFNVPGLPSDCSLVLKPSDGAGSMLIVRCSGFADQESASRAGQQMLNVLALTPLLTRVGLDVGKDAPRSAFTTAGLQWIEGSSAAESQALNDVHGLMVFGEERLPVFCSLGPMQPVVSSPVEWLVEAIQRLHREPVAPLSRHVLALDLFSAAQFEGSVRARFLLLITVVEVLSERITRPPSSLGLLDGFVDQTSSSGLERSETDALLGGLANLRWQSIGAACGALVRKHAGPERERFFRECYGARSKLGHEGETDFDIAANVHRLEELDRSLLRGEIGV